MRGLLQTDWRKCERRQSHLRDCHWQTKHTGADTTTAQTARSIGWTVSYKRLCLKLKLLLEKCCCRLDFHAFVLSVVRMISKWYISVDFQNIHICVSGATVVYARCLCCWCLGERAEGISKPFCWLQPTVVYQSRMRSETCKLFYFLNMFSFVYFLLITCTFSPIALCSWLTVSQNFSRCTLIYMPCILTVRKLF